MQQDGFAADSVRMIRSIRAESPRVQILLFSATFNDTVRDFAIKFAGKDANQVRAPTRPFRKPGQQPPSNAVISSISQWTVNCVGGLKASARTGVCAKGGAVAGRHQAVQSGEQNSCQYCALRKDGACWTASWLILQNARPLDCCCFCAGVPDAARQVQCFERDDLPAHPEAGPDHHFCQDQGNCASAAQPGQSSGVLLPLLTPMKRVA